MELDGNMIGLVTLATAGIAAYVKRETKLTELETRLGVLEEQDNKIQTKLDKILDEITTIKIELQNKQDRL